MTKTKNKVEKREFDAEISKVLNLMIHSLYTNKDIFMRELISNASDACDKLRYLAISEPALLENDTDFKISISLTEDRVIIRDNGVGMNKQDLIDNLGTIARSGTQRFAEALSGDSKKDNMLIGQFGVGFYSSYMVADKVDVISKRAGESQAYSWSSEGAGTYEIGEYDGDFARGTEITLHIKKEFPEYLDHFRLKNIIKTYSDHIFVPIFFKNSEDTEAVQVNTSSALWMRPKSEITQEEYEEFYKSVSYAIDKPWITMHSKNEGAVEFANLLFVPTNKTFDLFHPDRKTRVKLYIKRVFINEENIDLIPSYLRFLRGVIDSEDLPLNISRETLQHNSVLSRIKSSITKKVLYELKKKKDDAREEYEIFWQNFGAVLKEGLCEAMAEHEKIMEVCLFRSALQNKMISLDEYIANMAADQKEIFFLSGDNIDKIKNSPQLEGFLAKNIDVLLFTDSVDDFWVNVVHEYKEKTITSVTKATIDLNDKKDEAEQKTLDENMDRLIAYFKTTLGTLVKDVRISKKLTASPVCLAVSENAMDIRMERFLIEQKQLNASSAKILEINANHPIIKKLACDMKEDLVHLLFEQACIIEGEAVPDPAGFAKRMNEVLAKGF
jgi:molecular chaperone HtpG